MTFPAGRGLSQKCSEIFCYASVLSVIAGSVTCFINMPAVVQQQHYFLHSSYWHMDSMYVQSGSWLNETTTTSTTTTTILHYRRGLFSLSYLISLKLDDWDIDILRLNFQWLFLLIDVYI